MEVDEVAKKDKSVIDTTAGNKKYSDEDEVQQYFDKIKLVEVLNTMKGNEKDLAVKDEIKNLLKKLKEKPKKA